MPRCCKKDLLFPLLLETIVSASPPLSCFSNSPMEMKQHDIAYLWQLTLPHNNAEECG